MILDMKLTVSKKTGANIINLVDGKKLYFKTLGDSDGIARCKKWCKIIDFAINPNTLPKLS